MLGHLLWRWLCLGREVDKNLKSQILLQRFPVREYVFSGMKAFLVERVMYFLFLNNSLIPSSWTAVVHHGSVTLLSSCLPFLPQGTILFCILFLTLYVQREACFGCCLQWAVLSGQSPGCPGAGMMTLTAFDEPCKVCPEDGSGQPQPCTTWEAEVIVPWWPRRVSETEQGKPEVVHKLPALWARSCAMVLPKALCTSACPAQTGAHFLWLKRAVVGR